MFQVEIKGLSFRYRESRKYALKNVNLRVKKGEFILITGPTGCGKTTLARTFNGLIPHFYEGDFKGKVEVDGIDTRNSNVSELSRKVGLVFQNPDNQFVTLSVKKEVAFGLENLGLPENEIKRKVEETIREFNLREIQDKPPYMLSGGEKQRTIIASVIAMGTEILVLDEPTSNLDPLSARRIIDLLHRLNKEQDKTIILIEHRTGYAAKYANRAILMADGEILLNGDPRNVFSSEEAVEIGVFIPKSISLYKYLFKKGLMLERIPLSPIEAISIINNKLLRKAEM